MRLNNKGFAPFSLLIAIGAVILCICLTIPRTNEYADIAPMKAAKSTASDDGKVKIKAGQEFTILGVDKAYSARDKKKQLMLLVQNSLGERDLFNPDLISEEQMQEILPALKHSEYSNSPALFCRKTITRKSIDSIPLGISIEEMDSRLVPTGRIITEDGYQTAKYLRMEVFDRKSGKFYTPYMKFKDGQYCGCELQEPQRKHMNPWLMKLLPGADWVYDHNIFNAGFQKKAFGRLWLNQGDDDKVVIDMDKGNFLVKLMGIAIALLFFIVIFAFYTLIPLLPSYAFYGLLLFPLLFKPFNRTLTSIIVVVLAALSYYYCWLTFMPYMSFFIMPLIMIPAAKSAIIPLLSDEICDKCRYMNTLNFDHRELSGEYDTEKDVDSTRKIGSRVTGKRQTWDETTHTTKDAYTGNIVNQYKTKDNVKNYTDYEDTYQTDTYHQKFHVKQYINYFKCEVCGNVTTMTDSERDLLSSKLVGRHRSTGTRTVQH